MYSSLLILKRIVDRNNTPVVSSKKVFDENQKCFIAIVGIDDKHTGRKPELIECFSVPDMYAKLRFMLPRNGMPPYNYVMGCVRDNNGYFQLIKRDINGSTFYRA